MRITITGLPETITGLPEIDEIEQQILGRAFIRVLNARNVDTYNVLVKFENEAQ